VARWGSRHLSRHGVKTTKNVRKARMKEMTQQNAEVEFLDNVAWRAIRRSIK